jgi:DNA ligase-4
VFNEFAHCFGHYTNFPQQSQNCCPTVSTPDYRLSSKASYHTLICALTPQVGVMIARPAHEKARSIKHCLHLAGPRRTSVERKYDGEYCQIHIDLNKARDRIKIFSKSGKDSISDRIGLHRALRDSLELDTDCKIKKQCILEGELLIWKDNDERIEPFHKIRRYMKRSGHFIETARNSPVDLNKYFIIIFYDILLLDDTICIREFHDRRRYLFKSLIYCIPDRTDIGSREIIDFSFLDASELFRKVFIRAITR